MEIIDLSTPLYSGMKIYPGDPEVEINIKHTYEEEGWELRQLIMGSHTGSHVDAFSHMHQNKSSIDKIPLNQFFGPAQVVEKFDNWPNNIGLFFREEMDLNHLNQILEGKPNFVGGNISENLERALLKENIITYTGLVNLDCIPLRKNFTFYGFPLKIQDGDGSPVRAIAIIE